MKFVVTPSVLKGSAQIPGNKSGTARGVILGSLASGTTILYNPLTNADSYSIINMARALGAKIDDSENSRWLIHGTDGNLTNPADALDAQNSGTGFYFFTAITSLINSATELTGDEQTCSRPVQTMLDAIKQLGGQAVSKRQNGKPPVLVTGPISGGECTIEGTSSQWLSAFLITCPLAKKDTLIHVKNLRERPYVDMTISMQHLAGIEVENRNYADFFVRGNQFYKAFEYIIPADWGSALYPLVGALITAGSRVTLRGLSSNDFAGERNLIEVFRTMGANITVSETAKSAVISEKLKNSELADITVTGGAELTGCQIDCSGMPDALPILAVLGCFAKGKTLLTNIGSCRIKETDRVKTIRSELEKMGARFEETEETLTIYQSELHGAHIDGHRDHRIVMAMTVAALGAKGQSEISGSENAAVSFPGFYELFVSLNANLTQFDT